jgi:hypothetical protein
VLALSAAIEAFVEVIATLARFELMLEPKADRLDVVVDAAPRGEGAAHDAIAALATGESGVLSALPRDTALAVWTAGAKGQPSTADAGSVAQFFGGRLNARDQERLDSALRAFSAGRGTSNVYALLPQGFVMKSDVADADAIEKGLRGLVGLLELPAIAEPVAALIGRPRVQRGRVQFQGRPTERAVITFQRAARGGLPSATERFELMWQVEQAQALVALAREASPALAAVRAADARQAPTLAEDATARAALERLGKGMTLAAFARPEALLLGTGESVAVLGAGRRGQRGFLRAEVPEALLQRLAQGLAEF